MSRINKKSTRKSKLVPRLYDYENDYPQMQDENKMQFDAVPIPRPPPADKLSFDVKVEVEEFDEKLLSIPDDSCHEALQPVKIEVDSEAERDCDNNTQNISNKYLHKTKNTPVHGLIRQCKIDAKVILRDLEKLANMTTNVGDKILENEMRNTWGRTLYEVHKEDYITFSITKCIEKWKVWSYGSIQRDTPVMYKCYVCNLGWWHLWPFREHAHTIHHPGKMLNISLEIIQHESFIVAHLENLPGKPKEVAIDGFCYKCGRGADFHRINQYTCNYCMNRFYSTCNTLREHEVTCSRYKIKLREENPDNLEFFKCHLCKIVESTYSALEQHYQYFHMVRSDIPEELVVKVCSSCSQLYSTISLHSCPLKPGYIVCVACRKRYASTLLCDIHKQNSAVNYKCKLCDEVLPNQCMEIRHIVEKHSTNYMMVAKCMICIENVLFLDESSLKLHMIHVHRNKKYERRRRFLEVIVPKMIAESNLVEAISVNISGKMMNLYNESNSSNGSAEPESDASNIIITEIYGSCAENRQLEKKESNAKGDTATHLPATVKTEPVDEEIEDNEDYEEDITIKEEMVEEQSAENGTDKFNYEDILSRMFGVAKQGGAEVKVKQELGEDVFAEVIKTDEEDDFVEDLISLNKPPEAVESDAESDVSSKYASDDVDFEVVKKPKKNCDKCKFSGTPCEFSKHLEFCCKPLRCTKCDKDYFTMKSYVRHYSTVHGHKENTCPVCAATLSGTSYLINHVRGEVSRSFNKLRSYNKTNRGAGVQVANHCKKCKVEVPVGSMFVHWETHLVLGKGVEQDNAGDKQAMVHAQALAVQLLQKPDDYWTSNRDCVVCAKPFNRKADFQRHLIEHLYNDSANRFGQHHGYSCQICGEVADKGYLYRQHMRIHACLPLYSCSMCNKDFSDSSNFAKHKKIHNFNVLTCKICKKKFHIVKQLEKHLELHQQTTPNTCSCCEKVFYDLPAYKRHLRSMSSRQFPMYPCQVCRMKFPSFRSKLDHMWEVHGVRNQNVDCPVCGKPFRKLLDVTKHLREVHGCRPGEHMKILKSRIKNNAKKKKK